MADHPFELSPEILLEIETRVIRRLDDLHLYASCEYNSDDHLMLVAVPMTKDVVGSVVLEGRTFDDLFASGWYKKWYRSPDSSKMLPEYPADEIARHYARQMINFYRHPEQQAWQYWYVERHVP